ncbi:MAG: histidinol-phosphatase [Rikenellaceae bacterium]|nr:histidinol-phosphatase [Rikenellaceae bacterium]
MKRYIVTLILVALGIASSVAKYNPDTERLFEKQVGRTEIIIPQVNGYNCYKADLHVHTIYSDGEVTPEERVREAWHDGLDILAITDHIETRRQERSMLKFLKNYSPDNKGFEPINTRCSRGVPADERGIIADLNFSYNLAKSQVKLYPDLFLIRGTEISREPVKIGHYCALFTKDNNTIYDRDDLQALRNAHAQGALITHNHPGWERTSVDITEFEQKAYDEGLIDGIEVVNGNAFYPKIVRRAIERKFYMVSATDTHKPTSEQFSSLGIFRNMTLIFAKEKSEKGIREALKARRTLCYSAGYVIGEERLLSDLFHASVKAEKVHENKEKGKVTFSLRNNSSIEYHITCGYRPYTIPALGAVTISVDKGEIPIVVTNMIHTERKNLEIKLNY